MVSLTLKVGYIFIAGKSVLCIIDQDMMNHNTVMLVQANGMRRSGMLVRCLSVLCLSNVPQLMVN